MSDRGHHGDAMRNRARPRVQWGEQPVRPLGWVAVFNGVQRRHDPASIERDARLRAEVSEAGGHGGAFDEFGAGHVAAEAGGRRRMRRP